MKMKGPQGDLRQLGGYEWLRGMLAVLVFNMQLNPAQDFPPYPCLNSGPYPPTHLLFSCNGLGSQICCVPFTLQIPRTWTGLFPVFEALT